MKKTLLLVVSVAISFYGFSQCTPDPAYAGESYGFWPDASEGLIEGFSEVTYEQTITFAVPDNGGDIDPAFAAYDVDSIQVTGVSGLPSGFTYSCNISDCVFLGGTLNCVEISGTTTEIGDFDITINLLIYASFSGGGLAVPYAYDEYTLTILDPNGIEELSSQNVSLGQNVPNPASDYTTIPFSVKEYGVVTFQVFNLMGERLFEQIVQARSGENELKFYPEGLTTGIYLYSLTNNGFTQTKRMMIKK